MRVRPEPAAFAETYNNNVPQVAWTTLVADLETPVSVMLKLAHGHANSFLLESVEGGAVRGRYSIVGLKPDLIWRCHGNKAEINRSALTDPDAFEPSDEGSLDSLRSVIAESRIDLPEGLPLLKHVAAKTGQRVCRIGAVVSVDGQFVASARARRIM